MHLKANCILDYEDDFEMTLLAQTLTNWFGPRVDKVDQISKKI